MGFFSFFKAKRPAVTTAVDDADLILFAPVTGSMLPLSEVPDLVISEKLIGDGIAFIPEGNSILSPCDGIVSRLVASNNAFAIRANNGIEVYVSCGIGSKSFIGAGMSAKVDIGANVKKGEPILNIDLSKASEYMESTVTSMIVVKSSADIDKVTAASGQAIAGETEAAWVLLKGNAED